MILQLVQQGKLSLSAPIGRWVPYVQDARRITVAMMLDMTSGIYNEPAGQLIAQAVTGEPIQELITSRILRPLHISHTSFPAATAPPARIVASGDNLQFDASEGGNVSTAAAVSIAQIMLPGATHIGVWNRSD